MILIFTKKVYGYQSDKINPKLISIKTHYKSQNLLFSQINKMMDLQLLKKIVHQY